MLPIKTSKNFDRDIRKTKLTTNLDKDHALTGNWQGWRDCHVANNLVLIYRNDGETLHLARLNSHSEIFG